MSNNSIAAFNLKPTELLELIPPSPEAEQLMKSIMDELSANIRSQRFYAEVDVQSIAESAIEETVVRLTSNGWDVSLNRMKKKLLVRFQKATLPRSPMSGDL